MSNNANGPAPPYTGAPPSNAEVAAEVQQLRNTTRGLQARVNEQQNAAPAGNSANESRGRDLGEALKPPKPEPFKGQAADVIPFLTLASYTPFTRPSFGESGNSRSFIGSHPCTSSFTEKVTGLSRF
ncbi:hypothetical protein FOXYS1_2772 [Fusarium oxysporum]|uniref:Uncharacterized protein n=1 Tax=Fusarium oxysporum TaxID=5507 RepID=A0A8H5EPF6_FUSOX|nr:hypothetical protein FOXYS1_2772 [Fusarium oxysporum]